MELTDADLAFLERLGGRPSPEASALIEDLDRWRHKDRDARPSEGSQGSPEFEAVLGAEPEVQREVHRWLLWQHGSRRIPWYGERAVASLGHWSLFKCCLPLDDDDLRAVVLASSVTRNGDVARFNMVAQSVESRRADGLESSADLYSAVQRSIDEIDYTSGGPNHYELDAWEAMARAVGVTPTPRPRLSTEPIWARLVLDDYAGFEGEAKTHWGRLLWHASTASGTKPTVKWLKAAARMIDAIGPGVAQSRLLGWIGMFAVGNLEGEEARERGELWTYDVNDLDALTMRGLLWIASCFEPDEELVRAIASVGEAATRRLSGVGMRSARVVTGGAWALAQVDDPSVIERLQLLRGRATQKTALGQIDKAIEQAAKRRGVPPELVSEVLAPTAGLTEVGCGRVEIGDHVAEITVVDGGKVALSWSDADSKPKKAVPAAVKTHHGDALKAVKAQVKDAQKALQLQRHRLDRAMLDGLQRGADHWREYLLNHPVAGVLTRRLIWVFGSGDGQRIGVWWDGGVRERDGTLITGLDGSTRVRLWHPIDRPDDEVAGWRAWLIEHGVVQPFKQAHREVYRLTDVEREERPVSERLAGYLMMQNQFKALTAERGWDYRLRVGGDHDNLPACRLLVSHGLRAELSLDDSGPDAVLTGGLAFYADKTKKGGRLSGGGGTRGGSGQPPVPWSDVPAVVFSEVMRDLDLYVSVAGLSPESDWRGEPAVWERHRDAGLRGGLRATGETRRALLKTLLPKLKIAKRCELTDRHLVVHGELNRYLIHLGSAGVLIEASGQHVCIVPAASLINRTSGRVFLPFEGDRTLAVILSKAFMLAEDKRIKDPTILSQIGR
ncbi:MAG: DUF4132 domain-containing protein [Planctomycetota bacterium]